MFRRLIAVLLIAFCGTASATIPLVSNYTADLAALGIGTGIRGPMAISPLCTQVASDWQIYDRSLGSAHTSDTVTATPYAPSYCNFFFNGATTSSQKTMTAAAASCPSNSTVSGSACVCNSGFTQDATATSCTASSASTCTGGATASSGYYDAGTSSTAGPAVITCAAGCSAVFYGTFPAGSALVGGVKHYFSLGSYTLGGGKCDSGAGSGFVGGTGNASTPLTAVPTDACGTGQTSGTVNGKTVCATAGSGTGPAPVAATAGSSSTQTSTVVTNADGSKTTTVTTSTTNADGSTGSTSVATNGTTGAVSTTKTGTDATPGATAAATAASAAASASTGSSNPCTANPSATGCGGTPATFSTIYTTKSQTVSKTLTSAQSTLASSPIGKAVGGFFTVSGGGTCPASVWTIPYLKATVEGVSLCSTLALMVYQVLAAAFLIVASFMAFRIAIE